MATALAPLREARRDPGDFAGRRLGERSFDFLRRDFRA
jgi:hypothetical protein